MKTIKHLLICATLTLSTSIAIAQFAPTSPVKISSVLPTGSGPDVTARLEADRLQARWSQSVVLAEINRGVNDALLPPDVKEKMANFGFTISTDLPQQVSDLMSTDSARYAEVLKKAKVSVY